MQAVSPSTPFSPARPSVTAVVVTYEPDASALARLIGILASQVEAIVVVDNASRRPADFPPLPSLTRIDMDSNRGVGAAQNVGIRAALAQGASHVLLFDQDSTPDAGLVAALLLAGQQAEAAGCRVGAVGPRVIDADGQDDGFVRFRNGRYEGVPATGDAAWIDCDMLIASGTLIPREVIDTVGTMAEDLFIDKVDTEWCLRAAASGYRLIGAPQALLHHRLGEAPVRVWLGRWRDLRLHKPFRYYYMVRNGLLLRRLPHRTPAWCRADRRQLLSLFVYFGVLHPRRGTPLWMMLRGLVDGLRRVSGPLR